MLGRCHDLSPSSRANAIDHTATARRRIQNAALSDFHVRVAPPGALDAYAATHDVFDRHPPSGVGVDHARLADDAFRESIQGERGEGVEIFLAAAPMDSL